MTVTGKNDWSLRSKISCPLVRCIDGEHMTVWHSPYGIHDRYGIKWLISRVQMSYSVDIQYKQIRLYWTFWGPISWAKELNITFSWHSFQEWLADSIQSISKETDHGFFGFPCAPITNSYMLKWPSFILGITRNFGECDSQEKCNKFFAVRVHLSLCYSNKSQQFPAFSEIILTGLLVPQWIPLCNEWKRVSCKSVTNHDRYHAKFECYIFERLNSDCLYRCLFGYWNRHLYISFSYCTKIKGYPNFPFFNIMSEVVAI